MTRADQPTGYVLLRTVREGAWDPYHFAVLHLSKAWIFVMEQRLKVVEPLGRDISFYSLTYWEEPMGYYSCDEQDEIGLLLQDLYADDLPWCFISLDGPAEHLYWRRPDDPPKAHMMMLHPDGNCYYMCFNARIDTDFATERFNLRELLGHV